MRSQFCEGEYSIILDGPARTTVTLYEKYFFSKEKPADQKIEIRFTFLQAKQRNRDLFSLSFHREKKDRAIKIQQPIIFVLCQTEIFVRPACGALNRRRPT